MKDLENKMVKIDRDLLRGRLENLMHNRTLIYVPDIMDHYRTNYGDDEWIENFEDEYVRFRDRKSYARRIYEWVMRK